MIGAKDGKYFNIMSLNLKIIKKLIKDNGGMTLMELIVAVALFTIIMLSVTSIFQLVIESQRNAIASQNLQEGMRYYMEIISKEIRMARRSDGICPANPPPSGINRIYNIDGVNKLYFKNKNNKCVSYYLSGGQLMIRKDDSIATATPNELRINSLNFSVNDNTITDPPTTIQPKITINMDAEVIGKEMHKQKIKLQTTISSRFYE